MAKKLFVGNLSWETTNDGLRKAFSSYGEITEAKVITDRDTGRSRGFGFVTFPRDEDASTAISKMDGTSLDGRAIKVNEAQERGPHEGNRRSRQSRR
jgi:RNA recognition motif-containing protein